MLNQILELCVILMCTLNSMTASGGLKKYDLVDLIKN